MTVAPVYCGKDAKTIAAWQVPPVRAVVLPVVPPAMEVPFPWVGVEGWVVTACGREDFPFPHHVPGTVEPRQVPTCVPVCSW